MLTTRKTIALTAVAMIFGVNAGSLAATAGDVEPAPTTITACVSNRGGGVVKLGVDITCDQGQTALTWGKEGPVGPQGQQGVQGLVGPPGVPGADGKPGDAGKDGTNGKDGASAYDLAKAADPTIVSPAAWLASLKGAKGDTGAAGPQGVQGATGANGKDGTNGLPGITGPMGPRGLKGDTGATGPACPKGYGVSKLTVITKVSPRRTKTIAACVK